MKYMNKSIEELHELLKEGKVTERELIDESLELSKKVEEEINKFDQENNINEVKKKCYSKNFEQINSYFEAN